jgi:hypothetical protein
MAVARLSPGRCSLAACPCTPCRCPPVPMPARADARPCRRSAGPAARRNGRQGADGEAARRSPGTRPCLRFRVKPPCSARSRPIMARNWPDHNENGTVVSSCLQPLGRRVPFLSFFRWLLHTTAEGEPQIARNCTRPFARWGALVTCCRELPPQRSVWNRAPSKGLATPRSVAR